MSDGVVVTEQDIKTAEEFMMKAFGIEKQKPKYAIEHRDLAKLMALYKNATVEK